MEPRLKVTYLPVADLVPYAHNAKEHPAWQVEQIAESIKQFGNCDPIAIWHNAEGAAEIVEGHGRLMALQLLGIDKAPTISLDHLDDEGRRAYTHVHNRLNMNTGFEGTILQADLDSLTGFDWKALGFKVDDDWFTSRERWDDSRTGDEEYDAFLEKFELKRTTDDCYTPDNIYEAVAEWVATEYGVKREDMVRPFYPGGDYRRERYPEGCVVVDNPPFSILAEIIRFYSDEGVRFFLFAPALTIFSSSSSSCVTCITLGVSVTYENGANVSTSFVTNLDDVRIRTAPDLYEVVEAANDVNLEAMHADLPKYSYPDEVMTASRGGYLSKYGQDVRIGFDECQRISALDAQKEQGKAIYGSGYLLSEKAAAEKAAATRWRLSEREWDIVHSLGGGAHD